VPEQPYAWIAEFEPALAGTMLRDLPAERLEAARPAAARLATAVRGADPMLALAAHRDGVAGVTADRVLVATAAAVEPHAADRVEVEHETLSAGGREVATGLAENDPGRLAAALELVRAAGGAGARAARPEQPPRADDPLELLRRLGELRDAGVIEPAEFEAKKAELLRRI
jgi:Short C-terminal domain